MNVGRSGRLRDRRPAWPVLAGLMTAVTITARLKSLPSGELQTEPDGTRISVRDTAAKMISISDNTAANMLINLVGRPAVEAALTTTGMADPRLRIPRRPRPGLSPIGDVLSLNDGGLQLDRARWKTIWFKGGSEPGVLTLAYLATTRTGQSYVVAVLAENPSAPIDEATAAPAMLSAVKGAFTLAARG
jgi:Beta-lactamase enzyme family